MPDFAIIPELPAGHPINGNRSVARLVSVQTVVVSLVPTVTIHATETGASPYIIAMDVAHVGPSDTFSVNVATPSVSVQATETASATRRGV
jgi:hypothetical protein